MESQLHHESLSNSKCDTDKNMNITDIHTPGNDSVDTSQESGLIPLGNDKGRNFNVPATEVGDNKAFNIYGSKLYEQLTLSLQKPIRPSIEDPQRSYQQLKVGLNNNQAGNAVINVPQNDTANAGSIVANVMNGYSFPGALVNSVTSSLVVSTSEIKSEISRIASTANVASTTSETATPLPSPASSVTVPSPCEVSSSKPLSGSVKNRIKRRRRGSAWTDEETEYLMEVWAQQSELITQKGGDESVTCAPVYRLISRAMADQGWDKSWEQCKTRIHTLKRAYKITKDEITVGSPTITYCRHFDTLEIINGDNPQVTPGMLAAGLAQKRKEREPEVKNKKQPVRRKLTVCENPNLVKRVNTGDNVPAVGVFSQVQNSYPVLANSVNTQNNTCTDTAWYPSLPPQQQQAHQQQQQSSDNLNQDSQESFPMSDLPPSPQYLYQTPTSGGNGVLPPPCSSVVEVNNNDILVKSEKPGLTNNEQHSKEYVQPGTQWNAFASPQPSALKAALAQQTTSTGNDLERMRLDLEIRKLDVERNKIEMEERQRREERDHQYRMMQLLLFGLGQQNTSQLLSGQGPDVTNAHGTDLLRALEHGLVPGGSQKANEKGLSFSEL